VPAEFLHSFIWGAFLDCWIPAFNHIRTKTQPRRLAVREFPVF
jgi:hypothetical protein